MLHFHIELCSGSFTGNIFLHTTQRNAPQCVYHSKIRRYNLKYRVHDHPFVPRLPWLALCGRGHFLRDSAGGFIGSAHNLHYYLFIYLFIYLLSLRCKVYSCLFNPIKIIFSQQKTKQPSILSRNNKRCSYQLTTLYTKSLTQLCYSTATVSHPIPLSAANCSSRLNFSVCNPSYPSPTVSECTYVHSLNLRRKVMNCPQLMPAIALSVVPTMFGYNRQLRKITHNPTYDLHYAWFPCGSPCKQYRRSSFNRWPLAAETRVQSHVSFVRPITSVVRCHYHSVCHQRCVTLARDSAVMQCVCRLRTPDHKCPRNSQISAKEHNPTSDLCLLKNKHPYTTIRVRRFHTNNCARRRILLIWISDEEQI
jgi:hypothetical protein